MITREELERRRATGGISYAEYAEALGSAADEPIDTNPEPLGEGHTGPERVELRPGRRYNLEAK